MEEKNEDSHTVMAKGLEEMNAQNSFSSKSIATKQRFILKDYTKNKRRAQNIFFIIDFDINLIIPTEMHELNLFIFQLFLN